MTVWLLWDESYYEQELCGVYASQQAVEGAMEKEAKRASRRLHYRIAEARKLFWAEETEVQA